MSSDEASRESDSGSSDASDAISVLSEYRRIYEQHWNLTQSARALTKRGEQIEVNERASALRGENARIMAEVARQLRAVNIEFSEVSGGVRPPVVDRVIGIAIERHRSLDAQLASADPRRAPRTAQSSSARRTVASVLVALTIACGVGAWLLARGQLF